MRSRAEEVILALRGLLRATGAHTRHLAARAGLSTAQLLTLSALLGEEGLTLKTLAGRIGVTQATATALVNRLEHKGLVARLRSERDRRVVHVAATEAGRALAARTPDALQESFVAGFEALPSWEQAMILAALERVGALLDRAPPPPPAQE